MNWILLAGTATPSHYDWPLFWATITLCLITLGLAIFTGLLFKATKDLAEEAKDTSAQQHTEATASIEQATRAAVEMARVADQVEISAKAAIANTDLLKERTALQLRAFLVVSVGVSIYQIRERNWRFQAKAQLSNVGSTPALKVYGRTNSMILPVPLSSGFNFPLPDVGEGPMVVGSQQSLEISALPLDFVPDQDVEAIKAGAGRALCFWGELTYEDLFGESHQTKFCHLITWRHINAEEASSFVVCDARYTDMT